MLLFLHRDFTFVYKGKIRAYVKGNILKIDSRYVRWEDMMCVLAYKLKEVNCCLYCGTTLNKQNSALSHMFSKRFGGVSISNNLYPCCEECYSEKGDLSAEEFWGLRKKTKEEKDKLTKEIIKKNEKLRHIKGGFLIPEDWLSYCDIKTLKVRKYYLENDTDLQKVDENLKYIEEFGHLQSPIIVDKNYWIVDGYTGYIAAKEKQLDLVPVIVMENVELMKL